MATGIYYAGLAAMMRGEVDWETDTIRVAMVDTSEYTPDLVVDAVLDDVPEAALIASETIGNKQVAVTEYGATADGDDVTFSGVSGATCGALLIYQDTGDPGTSRLLAYIDDGIGLPVTLTGQTVIIVWDNADDRIMRLGPCAISVGS